MDLASPLHQQPYPTLARPVCLAFAIDVISRTLAAARANWTPSGTAIPLVFSSRLGRQLPPVHFQVTKIDPRERGYQRQRHHYGDHGGHIREWREREGL